ACALPILLEDPRFANGGKRLENREALWALLEEAFRTRPAAEWIAPLEELGVPVALIKTVPEALEDARAGERNMITAMTSNAGDTIEVVGNPIKFVGAAEPAPSYPPVLGEDAGPVLSQWLDMSQAEVDSLLGEGIVTQRAAASI